MKKFLKIVLSIISGTFLLFLILAIVLPDSEETKAKKEQEKILKLEQEKMENIKKEYADQGYYDVDIIDNKIYVNVGYYKDYKTRAFTVYTTEIDKNKLIEYGNKKMYSAGGQTVVHFFNDLNKTPNNTNYKGLQTGVWLRNSLLKDNLNYLIGTYQKTMTGKIEWYEKTDSIFELDDKNY